MKETGWGKEKGGREPEMGCAKIKATQPYQLFVGGVG